MPLQLVPLVGGLQGHIDPRLLPDGALSDAVNCEFERDGRVVGRARYQAIAATVYGSGTFVAYDLFSVGDRLFALGDRQSKGYPTDVFEYVRDAAASWVPSSRATDEHRLPRATRLRDIARPPDVAGGVSNFSAAASRGTVLLAYNNDDPDGTDNGYVHLVQANGDRTLLFDELSASSSLKLQAIGLSDRFHILALNSASTVLRILGLTPATDESVSTLNSTAYTGLGAISVFDACKVTGTDETVIVANCNGTVIVRRFNAAGVKQTPSGGDYANISANPTVVTVEASSSANQVVVGLVVAGVLRLYSYNLSTGATLQTAIDATFTSVAACTLVRTAADQVWAVASDADTNPEDNVAGRSFTPSSGAIVSTFRIPDLSLTSKAVLHGNEIVFGARYGSAATGPTLATNVLVSTAFSDSNVQLLAVKDLETACDPGVHLPDLTVDASTGKYYWCNATLGPDQDGGPVVTELLLGAAERRQIAVHGGHAYITGGLPCVFDLRYLSESGYTERARIISLTGGSGGSLLPGATYKYRVHPEQVDCQQDLHPGPPSEIKEITLSSSQNKVTARVSTGHSLRRNSAVSKMGVAQRNVLTRTLATVETTPAVLQGTAVITPPSSALNTLTLVIRVTDSGGSTTHTVTFDAGDVDAANIIATINAVASADLTATAEGDFLRLTSVEEGDGVTLAIVATSTAADILGLPADTNDEGTTTRTVGENFQRAASGYNGTNDLCGEFLDIVDTRKDETDPIVDTDLIRQGVLYSQGIASGAHHAPPPSEFVWAGRSRVVWSGQHRRSRWTVTKTIVPGEPAVCAAEGFLAFSGLVTGDIEAGAVLGDASAFWTRTQVWVVTGSGPSRAGQGEFFDPQCVSRRVGLIADGWRSMVEDDEGVWFQGNDGQLYHLSTGGSLTWRGKEIQDYLALYPVITAAAIRGSQQQVCFAVTNSAGNAGGILRYDVESKAWAFDDVGAVSALSDYQGRLCYVQAGVVYLQDATPGSGTGPNYHVATGMFQGFQALGYGQLNEVGILGTFRDDCVVTISRSRNGTSFSETLASWTLTTAEYAVGDRVILQKPPNPAMQDSFALKVAVSGMTDSEGLWLHAIGLDTDKSPFPSRQGPAHRA